MTARSAIEAATAQLAGPTARRDAETLFLHVMKRERAWLLAHPEAEVHPAQASEFSRLISRRAAQEPLQYILGQQEFFGLDFTVTPAVLIPRPETEWLVEATLAWAAQQSQHLRIADVGTGSGAIACALASRLPDAEVVGLDVSAAALAVASANAARLGLESRVRFAPSDLLASAVPESKWDAVVSNPPYIPLGDRESLEAQVREFEPALALFAGPDGLEVYRRLIPQAWTVLRPGGLLALEFGYGQADDVRTLLRGWSEPRILPDLAGIPRVALALHP